MLKVEYIAQADPGGDVPPWIANMFITKGPLETFRQLRKALATDTYKHASLAYIAN
jgi:hypothetical protein